MLKNTGRTSGLDKILEAFYRLGALGFAAVYTQVHSSERASALRVAELAYRFLKGEKAHDINEDADAANALREKEAHKALMKYPFKKKGESHG